MSELRRGDYDLVVGIATSIIPPAALSIPQHGFINIHPGVLPEYRGTGNLWAVVNRDWQRIGCTVHWMTERIDVGRIVAIEVLRDWPHDLWGLHEAAMRAGCRALAACLRSGTLLHAQIDVSGRCSGYFGWYGFVDYLRFKWAIACRQP
jgi:methionyl-tRNA formyltransferase